MNSSMGCRMCLPSPKLDAAAFWALYAPIRHPPHRIQGELLQNVSFAAPTPAALSAKAAKKDAPHTCPPFSPRRWDVSLYSCITLSRARGKDDVNIFHQIAISAMVGSWISSRLHHLFRRQAVSASPRSGFQLRGCGAARFLSPISPTRTNINAKPVSLPFAAGVLLWQQIILNEFSWTIALCE